MRFKIEFEWERVGDSRRVKVFKGWLVETSNGVAFVPDTDHMWTILEKKIEPEPEVIKMPYHF